MIAAAPALPIPASALPGTPAPGPEQLKAPAAAFEALLLRQMLAPLAGNADPALQSAIGALAERLAADLPFGVATLLESRA